MCREKREYMHAPPVVDSLTCEFLCFFFFFKTVHRCPSLPPLKTENLSAAAAAVADQEGRLLC